MKHPKTCRTKQAQAPILASSFYSTRTVPDTGLPASMPAEKLLALLKASDEMMQSIFRRDRHATLNTVVRHVHDILEAEACSIFLVAEGFPRELALAARYTDLFQYNFDHVTVPIQSVKRGGFVGHIADQGRIIRLHGDAILNNEYVADPHTPYLKPGLHFSTLAIPLMDRKNRVLGVVKVDNKKSANGKPNAETIFDEVDEAIAKVLANKIVIVLENMRTFEALRDLMSKMSTAVDIYEILDVILRMGLTLVHADRGEFVFWDSAKGKLILAAQYGESNLGKGDCPQNSIAHAMWINGEPHRLIPDVRSDPDFFEVNPKTRSEVLVRFAIEEKDIGSKGIGLLNAESFQLNGFDEQDLELLKLVAQYAASAIRVVQTQSSFRSIESFMDSMTESPNTRRILQSIKDIYGFNNGVIYIADYTKRELRCSDWIGLEFAEADPRKELRFHFDEPNVLVAKVLREREGYFSPDPASDPYINRIGKEKFQLEQPLVAVPLIHEERVVGVLVVWSHTSPLAKPDHVRLLRPFARLAAAHIAMPEAARRRTERLGEIQTILARQALFKFSLQENLSVILRAVQSAGFERVRVYEFNEDIRSFVGLYSLGMDDPKQFEGYTIAVERNPYAKHTAESALPNPITGEYPSATGGLPTAREYNPTQSDFFGDDPDAEKLGKPRDLPWVAVPLVIDGRLYGQITADNAHTRRAIESESLEYMTLLGAMAAQAIANAEIFDLERSRATAEAHSDLARRTIHDLRTPAFATQAFLEELVAELQALPEIPDEILDLSEDIREQVNRISATADGMQRLTRPVEPRHKPVNINELALRAVRQSRTTRDCKIEFDLCQLDPIVTVDANEIDQAITQVAANAWQAMKDQGKLSVKTQVSLGAGLPGFSEKPDQSFILILLRDSGPGVPRSVWSNLFKAGVSTTGGRGLGLYSAKMIVEEHSGRIWLEDTGPHGSTFVIALPHDNDNNYVREVS